MRYAVTSKNEAEFSDTLTEAKYENFRAALNNLREVYAYTPPYDTVTLAGLVSLYAQCFEQAWKVMKAVLEENGFQDAATGSPRQVLKTAFQAGMIRDEALWLDALQERNNVAHSYNREIALSIVERTRSDFYPLFCSLQQELQDRWL